MSLLDSDGGRSIDESAKALVASGGIEHAATLTLRALGPEVFGFLIASLGSKVDADDVFASVGERVWRSIASFRWQCSLRTWIYVIARNETARFIRGARRHDQGRVTPSELENVVAAVRSETHSRRSEKVSKLHQLRDELPIEDRTVLVLRVDRGLQWEEIARVFLDGSDDPAEEDLKREAARLRKRFQLVKRRLGERARREGLIS